MLAIKPKIQYFTREIIAPNGEAVIGLFAVSEINGVPQVRLIAVRPTAKAENFSDNSSILALAGNCAKCIPEIIFECFEAVADFPYKDFSFFNSQPTRAPSIA